MFVHWMGDFVRVFFNRKEYESVELIDTLKIIVSCSPNVFQESHSELIWSTCEHLITSFTVIDEAVLVLALIGCCLLSRRMSSRRPDSPGYLSPLFYFPARFGSFTSCLPSSDPGSTWVTSGEKKSNVLSGTIFIINIPGGNYCYSYSLNAKEVGFSLTNCSRRESRQSWRKDLLIIGSFHFSACAIKPGVRCRTHFVVYPNTDL